MPSVKASSLGEANLDLVGDHRHGADGLDGGHQAGPAVAQAEETDLAGAFQLREGLGDLLGVGQEVGPVQEVKVHSLEAETAERSLASGDQVAGREVPAGRGVRQRIARRADAALGDNEDLVPHAGRVLEDLAQEPLGLAAAIDVGVVKNRITGLISGPHGSPSGGAACRGDLGGVPGAGHPPAAVSQLAAR